MSIEDKEERTPPPTDNLVPQGSKDNGSGSATTETTQGSDGADAIPKAAKRRTSKSKEAGIGDTARQMDTAVKPARKTRAAAKVTDAAELPASAPSEPKRTRRRASPSKDVKLDVAQPASHRADVPPVTEEAIAFLANSDAKVPELFKLQPESREFVLYHMSNLQRLDADIAAGRSYLVAHMPKFSPEFEKTADALLAKLAHSRTASITATPKADKSTLTRSPHFYGPRQVTEVVQVRTPAPVAELKNRESEVENTIERGPVLKLDKPPAIDVAAPTPASAAESKSLPGFGKKVLQVMGNTADVAGAWLHSKAKQAETSRMAEPSPDSVKQPVPLEGSARVVPASVARRFLKVEAEYYFPDKSPAFSDRGDKLATRGAHPEVVRSLVEIAQARGWTSITVKGTDEFRRSAWMEAAQAGMKVAGYRPTALDLAELANRPARNAVEKGRQRDLDKVPAAPAARQPDTGADQPPVWQLDSVATKSSESPLLKADLVAKASAFEKDKPSFVLKNHPELAPAYGVVDVARKFAEAHLPEEAREEFVGLARRHVIQKIVTGESVKGPKIYVAHARSRPAPEQTSAVAKEAIDQGESPRAKEVAKER
ncbi:LPD7 domain-containing protein [Massilia cellulosiltytica]|uniref:LPD7 domain-containing protein n=1 Tax=Massilia cellulosiltytica TaxID=2683234 RepID=UPI0039B68B76